MIKNYLKIALRSLRRQKVYALINVLGLTVGLACCFLIGFFVQHELRFDRFNTNADRIYRIVEKYFEEGKLVEESASIPIPFGPTFAEFAGLKTTRFYQTYQKTPLIGYQEKRFYEPRLFFTDSTVFDLFTFPLVEGDPMTALAEPFTMVVTASTARKYFGDEDPVGKVLTFEGKLDFRITGVARDVPSNAHFQFDFLAAMQNLGEILQATGNESDWQGWFWNPSHTYVLLPPGVKAETVEATLPDFVKTHFPTWLQDDVSYHFQPLTDIHLHSNLAQEIQPNGSLRTVQLFVVIALLILLIACINFINLATARSLQRAREVGMRKVLGARRAQLIQQFVGESLLVSLVAAVLAAVLAVVLLPAFGQVAGTTLPRALATQPLFFGVVLAVMLLVGVLAGLYPALVLSAFEPVHTLQGGGTARGASAMVRKSLVVAQFAISMLLLASTFVVYRQLQYMQQKDLGFVKDQVVMIPIRGTSVLANYEAFKDEVRREAGVLGVTALSDVVGREVTVRSFDVEGRDDPLPFSVLYADADFARTFDVAIEQGRDFDLTRETDQKAALVNAALVRELGWQGEVLGKWVGLKRPVIGVTEDFNFAPLRQQVRPLIIAISAKEFAFLAVRLVPGDARPTLAALERTWSRFEAGRPFEPFFLDQDLDTLYGSEARLGVSYGAFSLLAILIACLGLFGLAAFTAEQRTKEIGVRKALGASVGSILVLLSKDFVRLVLVAFVIATPIAYFVLDRWLRNFAYHTDVSWWVFLLAGLVALLVALLTVSFQAIRAATANPVEALRVE